MRVALITTTINVPKVLALYRQLGPRVMMFVAADEKTPLEAYEFCASINCEIYSPDHQSDLGYECSELLGWNNDSRRNIALLEAVKAGADIIVSVDDDMIPTEKDFFERFDSVLSGHHSGLQLGAPGEWFDAGQFTTPPARQRGLPVDCKTSHDFSLTMDVQIGAAQGIILGVPDTDAFTTISNKPFVTGVSDVLRTGFVVDPNAKAVFNSQITAFRRELAPCFAQFYKWQGRNTDIFASLIMRRIMREKNLHTYYGPPIGFHARSLRDPLHDLNTEMWGIERVQAFSNCLDHCILPTDSVIENLHWIWLALGESRQVEQECLHAARAFLSDMERVL